MSPAAGLLLLSLTGCGVDWCGRFDISCSVDSQSYSFALDEDRDGDGWSYLLDCNDADPLIHPFGEEQCNGADDDCDDAIDEGLATLPFWPDLDEDGFGGAGAPHVMSCAGGAIGLADNDLDCDDLNAAASPIGQEQCDGADNDCDGWIDVNPLDGGVEAAADVDGDGAIDPTVTAFTCPEAPGWSTNPFALVDCDDTDPAVAPGNSELCDGRDNDCDGRDERTDDLDVVDGIVVYPDRDLDGFGSALLPGWVACQTSPGLSIEETDCNDHAPEAKPDGEEVCDGLDNDCDGEIDGFSASDAILVYEDLDGDGWGGAAVLACAAEAPLVALGGDCDDFNATAHPYALGEPCDGTIDLNCDGKVGPGDADGDSFVACEDCDDTDNAIHPGAEERCDDLSADEDCDGSANAADPDITQAGPHFEDLDGDGFGSDTLAVGCVPTVGVAAQSGDCDDADPTTFPGAAERCGGEGDTNCDGVVGACDDGEPLLAAQAHLLILGLPGDALGDALLPIPGGGLYIGAPRAQSGGGLVFRLLPGDLTAGQTLAREAIEPAAIGFKAQMYLGAGLAWAHSPEGEATLVVSSPHEDWLAHNAGGLRIYSDPPGAEPLATIGGASQDGGLGTAVWVEPDAAAIWVSTPNYLSEDGEQSGRVDRFLLPLEPLSSPDDAIQTLRGEVASGSIGEEMGAAGDLNGDGLPELHLACTRCLPSGDEVGLIFTDPQAAAVLTDADWILRQPDRWGPPSPGPLAAGDLDQDGLDDLLIGLPDVDSMPERGGTARIFYSTGQLAAGPGELHLREAEAAILSKRLGDELGASVAIEADATEGPLIWLGAPGAGAVYALSPGTGALPLPDPRMADPSAWLGEGLLVGQDLNSDGAVDLLVRGAETIAILFGG